MAKTITKEAAFTELRNTLKFLMSEQEKGNESFEVADFLDIELEDRIIKNFNNIINRDEYENVISDLFGKIDRKKSSVSTAALQKEIDKLIRQYRVRSKKAIFDKLVEKFTPPRDEYPIISEVIKERYRKLMRDPLTKKIASMVKAGTRELRMVTSVLRREKYDADSEFIEELLNKALSDLDRTKKKYQRGGARSKKFKIDDPSPMKERLREQMRKSMMQKSRYNKQRFMRKECPSFRFEQTDSTTDNEMRALVHSGDYKKSVISIKTLLTNDRITDVQVTVAKSGKTQGATLNVTEFQKSVTAKQGEAFLQRWLKTAIKHVQLNNIQEVIWFLASVLNDRFGLPEGVSRYLSTRLVDHMNGLDRFLTKFVIDKAVENVK
ncbi:MAG: hypothetical protein GY863_02280 [bacterium]|nr:hypothetical protein [bacterium]